MNETENRTLSRIYLMGDPGPLVCSLPVEEILSRIADATHVSMGEGLAFIRVPIESGEALVRPQAIAAVLPGDPEDDE